ncbi:alpha/beta fold hydrolase [Glycomyces harbinensis]|uniref:alpha/beta fold hydrolase n=1 Tax=Glycomyces harbinensis TaxID=58114 RepID=UPI001C40B40E|nr:alpha/beta fold hydrolase [Glycomyces harbinensis]
MDDLLLVLVHSPLTGAQAWRPAAVALRSMGRRVAVPDFEAVFERDGPYHQAVASAVADQIDAHPGMRVVLVAHSGAGALLPAITASVGSAIGAVFVDALLPHPSRTWFDTVPRELRDRLASLAEGDRLPKWSDWFPPAAVAALLPEAAQREAFIAALPRMPLSYFAETAPDPQAWPPRWCAYVRCSEAYDAEAAEAARAGWPVRRVEGDHLSLLTRPEETARVIDAIVAASERR